MTDLFRPIPKTDFPYGLIITASPSDEPLVYLDDDFDCDSAYYYHCAETGGAPVPGSDYWTQHGKSSWITTTKKEKNY